MFVDVKIESDQELWRGYAERSNRELAAGQMLWVTVPESAEAKHLTFAEWEYLRNLYSRAARRAMKEHDMDVAAYAMADPGEDGGVACGHLGVNVMTMDEYEQFAKGFQKSVVYAVFSHSECKKGC